MIKYQINNHKFIAYTLDKYSKGICFDYIPFDSLEISYDTYNYAEIFTITDAILQLIDIGKLNISNYKNIITFDSIDIDKVNYLYYLIHLFIQSIVEDKNDDLREEFISLLINTYFTHISNAKEVLYNFIDFYESIEGNVFDKKILIYNNEVLNVNVENNDKYDFFQENFILLKEKFNI